MHSIQTSIIVNVPVDYCYEVWSDFARFPELMKRVRHVERVAASGHIPQGTPDDTGEVWRWTIEGMMGQRFSWAAAMVLNLPNKVISWAPVDDSLYASEIATSGSVNFLKLAPDLTLLEVKLTYSAPVPPFGELVADVFQIGDSLLADSLREFKTAVEARYSSGLPTEVPAERETPAALTPGLSLRDEARVMETEGDVRDETGEVVIRPPASEAEANDRLPQQGLLRTRLD